MLIKSQNSPSVEFDVDNSYYLYEASNDSFILNNTISNSSFDNGFVMLVTKRRAILSERLFERGV